MRTIIPIICVCFFSLACGTISQTQTAIPTLPAGTPVEQGDPIGELIEAPTPTINLTASPTPSNGEPTSTWDRYQPRTMSEVIQLITAELPDREITKTTLTVEPHPYYQYPSRVEMTYTGDFRDIPDLHSQIIVLWGEANNLDDPEAIGAGFQQQGRFISDGRDYWLNVQSQILPYFPQELSPGDSVTLFLFYAGAIRTPTSDEVDWVFLVNEFRKE
jgi:hypothetical protein